MKEKNGTVLFSNCKCNKMFPLIEWKHLPDI